MKLYVLDASAWIRLFLADGPMPVGLEEAAAQVEIGSASFVAPELILVESGQALCRKQRRGAFTLAELDSLWPDMRRTPMDLLNAVDHIDAAMALAGQYKVSVYDAMYLAVADHVGAPLFTADEALQRVAAAMKLNPN